VIDEDFILALERLRDEMIDFRSEIRRRYESPNRQVTAIELKERAARFAETWMIRVAQLPDVKAAIESDYLGDLNVHFQRILIYSEKATKREKYDSEIKAVLKEFTIRLIMPLKQRKGLHSAALEPSSQFLPAVTGREGWKPTAFLGQSFSPSDTSVVGCVKAALEGIGINVVTGEKPKADKVSEKVKKRIEAQFVFVGLFTRRDKVEGRSEWTTSPWLIDEKAYAVAKDKKLILLKEEGVTSIGGIQGDYEYVEFSRTELERLVLKIVEIFEVKAVGFRK
jgi:hypothetical protein